MRTVVAVLVCMCCANASAFAGNPVCASNHCVAQQVQVVQQQVTVPVATVPVTTGFAVPLQQYQYSVDPDAFSTYSEYLKLRYQGAQRTQAVTSAPPATAATTVQLDAETTNKIALEVIRILKEQGAITLTDDTPQPVQTAAPPAEQEFGPAQANAVKTMLAKKCAECHTRDMGPMGQVSFFTSGNELLGELPYARMLVRMKSSTKRMPPPPHSPLTDNEVALFEQWVKQRSTDK